MLDGMVYSRRKLMNGLGVSTEQDIIFQGVHTANDVVLSLTWLSMVNESYIVYSVASGIIAIMIAPASVGYSQDKKLPLKKGSIQQLNIEFALISVVSILEEQTIIVYGLSIDRSIVR